MQKKKNREKNFYSYKKLWKAYKIARGKSSDPKDPDRIKYAKKLEAVASGLYKRKLIENLPVFVELQECQVGQ